MYLSTSTSTEDFPEMYLSTFQVLYKLYLSTDVLKYKVLLPGSDSQPTIVMNELSANIGNCFNNIASHTLCLYREQSHNYHNNQIVIQFVRATQTHQLLRECATRYENCGDEGFPLAAADSWAGIFIFDVEMLKKKAFFCAT